MSRQRPHHLPGQQSSASRNGVIWRGSPSGRDPSSRGSRLADGARFGVVIVVTLAVLGAVAAVRASDRPSSIALTGALADLSPAELTTAAADVLDAATAKGGTGYTFEIVQRSSLNQQPGGALIDIPDPVNRGGSLGKTDHYELATFIERGAVAPGGFWLEIRDGPTKEAKPDFETAAYELGTIVRDGLTYRNDGDGWYETKDPPGIGLDPATAALLPTMLRGATERKDLDTTPTDGSQVARTLEATTTVADR